MFTTTTTFVVYILALLVIGIIAARVTSSLSDYVLGGRKLGRLVTALSAGASDMSGWLLMGLPGALYVSGISASWIAIGLTIGAWCNWKFVAARLRSFTANAADSLTLPDYFAARFQDSRRITSVLAAFIILIFFVVYCASGMVSGARLFEQTFGMDYENALLIGAVSTIFYVCIGGFLAVSWTDTFQATLMIFALLIAPAMMIVDAGGLNAAMDYIAEAKPGMTHFMDGIGLIAIISFAGWGLGYMGQPHILVRFMAAKSVRGMGDSRRISITWMILCLAGAVAVGYFGVAPAIDRNDSLLINAKYGPIDSVGMSFHKTAEVLQFTWVTLGKLITGSIPVNNISGPIAVARGAGETANMGVVYFLSFLGIISVNLGIVNLIPLPVLDGGHLLFYAIEAVFRRPVPEKVQRYLMSFGIAVLVLLTVFTVFNDIVYWN